MVLGMGTISFYQWSLVSLVRPVLNPHVFDTICLGAPPAGLASGFMMFPADD